MRLGITEESQDFIRRYGGNCSAHWRNSSDDRVVEIPRDPAEVLGIKVDSEPHRAHEVASQRGELPSLGFSRLRSGWLCVSTLGASHEFVSDAWNSYQESGSLRIRLNLAPEPSHK